MRRWILALAAVAVLASGPVMADQCQTPCSKAQATACGTKAACGPASACGQKMDCGPAGACGAKMMAMCGDRGGRHVSHDPGNIWYRGPAPKCALFDCLSGGCGPHGGMKCDVMVMRRHGMPGGGPMGDCGPRGGCGAMGGRGAMASCGDKAACGQGSACGGACKEMSACGDRVVIKKMVMKGSACGSAPACGNAKAACSHGPAGGGAGLKSEGMHKRGGSWQTGWSHCPSAKSGCCAG